LVYKSQILGLLGVLCAFVMAMMVYWL